MLMEEKLALRHPGRGGGFQKEGEDLGAHTAEDGHPLQRLYPCLFHDRSPEKPDAPHIVLAARARTKGATVSRPRATLCPAGRHASAIILTVANARSLPP